MKKGFCLLMLSGALLGRPADFLFYLHGTEETTALLPVLKRFELTHKSYLILADQAATQTLVKGSIPISRLLSFEECEIKIGEAIAPDRSLTKKEVHNILYRVQPRVVVAGVDYRMQGQVLEAYQQSKVMTVAYWAPHSHNEVAERVIRLANRIFFPSLNVASKPAFNDLKEDHKMVVGDPSSEEGVNTLFHALLFLLE